MNRIDKLFLERPGNLLSVYFTAGYPSLDSTCGIISSLARHGADLVEVGIPFSDPMADGPVIQKSSNIALRNGMSLSLLFSQLKNIRKTTGIPLLLMGYLNPVLQYGWARFCEDCSNAGIDGLILPDLPPDELQKPDGLSGTEEPIQKLLDRYDLCNVMLITPQTSDNRIRFLDRAGSGFLYMVSASATTGMRQGFSKEQVDYFSRIQELNLKTPRLIGFGISDRESFATACRYSSGAIIGSAFVKMLEEKGDSDESIEGFMRNIRGGV